MEDLDANIMKLETILEEIGESDPERARWLNNLGRHLNSRYERTGNPHDLEAAIARTEEAVEATAEGHPDRAGWLNNLGNYFEQPI